MTSAGWVAIIVATIAAFAAIVSAVISALAARAARQANRTVDMERTIEELHSDRHRLWFYCRQLVDHIYRGNPPPPPPPPEGLFQ